jgi:hypothetical protein
MFGIQYNTVYAREQNSYASVARNTGKKRIAKAKKHKGATRIPTPSLRLPAFVISV